MLRPLPPQTAGRAQAIRRTKKGERSERTGNNNFLCCHRGEAPFFGHPKSRLSVPFVSPLPPLAMTRNNQSDSREKEMRRSEQSFCAFAGLRSGAQTEKNMRGGRKEGINIQPLRSLHWTRRRDMRGRSRRRDRRVWRPAIEHPTKLFGIRFYIGTSRPNFYKYRFQS